jgi:type I restriction enzyme M protein
VIKNTFLSAADPASIALRKELLESCNLHTLLDMPQGTFQGAGVKTVVLFFHKGEATRRIWYYRLEPGRTLGKTNPLNDADMADFISRQTSFDEGPNSWSIDAAVLDPVTFELTVRNPNGPEAEALRSPIEILEDIARLDAESRTMLARVRELL